MPFLLVAEALTLNQEVSRTVSVNGHTDAPADDKHILVAAGCVGACREVSARYESGLQVCGKIA